MAQVEIDSMVFKLELISVQLRAAKVAGISNDLDTNDDHMKVDKIHTIFKIYDDLTKLMSSYGEMAKHDLKEVVQVGDNIEKTDREAK